LDGKICRLGPRGDRSTMDRRPLPHKGAHRSSVSGRSDARVLRPRGGGGEGWAGELNGGVTAGWEAVGGGISSTAAGSAVAVMTVSSGVGEMRRGGRQGSVRVAGCSGAFYRAEGRSRGGRPLKGGGGVVELH
jgi:hypothetical protein